VDTWVSEYNCDRSHQSLNMDYPAERFAPSQQFRHAEEELLPLRLPANLQPADAPQTPGLPDPATPEPIREDAEAPPAPVAYPGGPVELDRVVPASSNLAVRGIQFWLGSARAGLTVTFWANHDLIHLSTTVVGSRPSAPTSQLSTWPRWPPPTDVPPAVPAAPTRSRHRAGNRPHRGPRRHHLPGQPPTPRRGNPCRPPGQHPHRARHPDVL
jgi:hypothetical protein